MEFTCIVCEFKFHKNQMDMDERMCYDCLEEDTKIEYSNNLIRQRVDRENYKIGWKKTGRGSK